MVRKEIKKWGESLIISFDKEDQKAYGFEQGDILDISDMVVIKSEDKKHDK